MTPERLAAVVEEGYMGREVVVEIPKFTIERSLELRNVSTFQLLLLTYINLEYLITRKMHTNIKKVSFRKGVKQNNFISIYLIGSLNLIIDFLFKIILLYISGTLCLCLVSE